MEIRKNKGESTDPFGTPALTSNQEDTWPLKITQW